MTLPEKTRTNMMRAVYNDPRPRISKDSLGRWFWSLGFPFPCGISTTFSQAIKDGLAYKKQMQSGFNA